MSEKDRITRGLGEIGAAWAVSTEKYICTNVQCCDYPGGDVAAYHVHPDQDWPHVNNILKFYSLREIASYIKARKEAESVDDVEASRIMEDFYNSLE